MTSLLNKAQRPEHMIELELVDGTRVLVTNDWDKLYHIKEHIIYKWKLCSKFPFIARHKMRFTTFTYQDQYSTIRSGFDSMYTVKMSLQELALAFGQKITTFEECKVNADLQHCSNGV